MKPLVSGILLLASPLVAAEPVKGADMALLQETRAVAARVEKLREEKFATLPVAVRGSHETLQRLKTERAGGLVPAARLQARGSARVKSDGNAAMVMSSTNRP